jgi:hypothetical protein
VTGARARWTPDELATLLARECCARGLTDPDAGDRRVVAASVGAGHVTAAVWRVALDLVPVLAAAQARATAGPSCGFWADGGFCGARPVKLYLSGRRCPLHTPSAILGVPEPGVAAYGWPSRPATALVPPAGGRGPGCGVCLNPLDVVLAAAAITVHPACGTVIDDRPSTPAAGLLAASRSGA